MKDYIHILIKEEGYLFPDEEANRRENYYPKKIYCDNCDTNNDFLVKKGVKYKEALGDVACEICGCKLEL